MAQKNYLLALHMYNLVDLSIKQSWFSDQRKIETLKLLFKKGSKSDLENYWLISLLLVVSKIIKKNINIQTPEYLDENDLHFKYQSGFSANFPTNSYLVQLTNFILSGKDKYFTLGWC